MKFHFYNKSFVWIVDPDCIGETSLIRCLRNTNNCASWANFVFWDLMLNRTTLKKQNLLMVTSYIRPYSNRSNTFFFLTVHKIFLPTHDWPKRLQWPNMFWLKRGNIQWYTLSDIPHFSNFMSFTINLCLKFNLRWDSVSRLAIISKLALVTSGKIQVYSD